LQENIILILNGDDIYYVHRDIGIFEKVRSAECVTFASQHNNKTFHDKQNKNMKTVNVIIFALVSFSTSLFAESPATMAVIPNATSGVYKVCYKGAEAGKVKLSILNANSEVVFSEVMTGVSSFIRPYNFSQLTEGEYTIVLEDKAGKQVEQVSYHLNKVESLISVSKLAGFDNKFIVSVANKGTDLVNVRISDLAGNVLHDQTEKVDGHFALIYNLNEVKAYTSKVTFEVSTSGKTYTVTY
jgi:hypothetical protein